jgi:hypothetical protein
MKLRQRDPIRIAFLVWRQLKLDFDLWQSWKSHTLVVILPGVNLRVGINRTREEEESSVKIFTKSRGCFGQFWVSSEYRRLLWRKSLPFVEKPKTIWTCEVDRRRHLVSRLSLIRGLGRFNLSKTIGRTCDVIHGSMPISSHEQTRGSMFIMAQNIGQRKCNLEECLIWFCSNHRYKHDYRIPVCPHPEIHHP